MTESPWDVRRFLMDHNEQLFLEELHISRERERDRRGEMQHIWSRNADMNSECIPTNVKRPAQSG